MDEAAQIDAPPRRIVLSATDLVGDAARRALAFGVDALEGNRLAAESGEAEALHQLRVTTRRLRASIELFCDALYAAQVKVYRRDLPWIARQAGAARECDVIAALLESRAAKIDPALAGAIAPILDTLAERRTAEHRKLCALLDSKRYRNLIAKLSARRTRKLRGQRKLGAVAVPLIRPIARAGIRMGNKLAADAPPPVFHKLRVRLKRVRYALEMLSTLGAKRNRKALSRLEELQDTLGLCNDATVAAAWLRTYAETSAAPPATILAAGALIQSLAARERKLRRQSIKAWRRFERSAVLRSALDEIRRAGKEALAAAAAAESAPAAAADRSAAESNAAPDATAHVPEPQSDQSRAEPAPEFSP